MEDFQKDGYNDGYGRTWLNNGHEKPQSDGDRYSYRIGREEGQRHRDIAKEIDEELYGNQKY